MARTTALMTEGTREVYQKLNDAAAQMRWQIDVAFNHYHHLQKELERIRKASSGRLSTKENQLVHDKRMLRELLLSVAVLTEENLEKINESTLR